MVAGTWKDTNRRTPTTRMRGVEAIAAVLDAPALVEEVGGGVDGVHC
jgi:hypothetical protein